MSDHARLPEVTDRHLRRLQIINETRYDTRAIRSLVVRALRAQGMKSRGAVRVVYTTSTGPYVHHGLAAIGHGVRFSGLNMSLSLPRDPTKLDVGQFARVIRHEVMHWRGVQHEEMTHEQRYCLGPAPKWADGVTIEHRKPPPKKSAQELREKKLAHARAMLKRAETRAKRAATGVKKWQRRVKALTKAVEGAKTLTALGHGDPADNIDMTAAREAADEVKS